MIQSALSVTFVALFTLSAVASEYATLLTTGSNEIVLPVHEKAMPVILDKPKAWDTWLTGSVDDALQLQRPLPPERLAFVATNIRTDDQPVQTRMAM